MPELLEKYPKSGLVDGLLETQLFDRMGNQKEFKFLIDKAELGIFLFNKIY